MFSIGGCRCCEPGFGAQGRLEAARTVPGGAGRRGMVLLATIVCVAVATAVMLAIVKQAVLSRQETDLERFRVQAEWLAESGAGRAAARIAADPAYPGEDWLLPAAELGGPHAGRVQIQVKPIAGQSRELRVRVVADYPDGSIERVRKSKELRVRLRS